MATMMALVDAGEFFGIGAAVTLRAPSVTEDALRVCAQLDAALASETLRAPAGFDQARWPNTLAALAADVGVEL